MPTDEEGLHPVAGISVLEGRMKKALRVVIVGGVACGPKAASRLKRLMPDADVVMVERGQVVSYGACGLPYYVEGMFSEIGKLMETPVGVPRNAAFFEKVKGFKTLVRTEALSIDRGGKTVRVRNIETGGELDLPYDRLVLATGSRPVEPPIPGLSLGNVWYMRRPEDAETLVERIVSEGLKDAVVVGAGYIGVEMAEALRIRGLNVTLVDIFDQVLPQFLDREMALLVARHLRSKGVNLALGERVLELTGDGKVASVKTDRRVIPADMVVIGVGVRPNDELARAAGLTCSPAGGIVINGFNQTSDPDIYAGGDCTLNHWADPGVESPLFAPLGSTANKHGRIIADHISGRGIHFPGIAATAICKAFDFTLGRTGLTETRAGEFYPDVETAVWAGPDKPHYVSGSNPLVIKMVASRGSRQLLGVQIVGTGDVSKRLDVAAAALFFRGTVDQVANIDLGYAPPYSTPIDPIAAAAHLMANKLNGLARGISPIEARRRIDEKDGPVLLDVRTPGEYQAIRFPYENVVHIPLGALRERMRDLPRDRDILAFCKVSMRGYEAQLILNAAGFDRVWFIEGGIAAWPFELVANP